jgi:predicted ribosome-associated RNA-binding protein Tma20
MATVTILNLPGTNTVDASTVAPVVYSGTTYKATLTTLGAFINTNAVAVTASGNIAGGNLLTNGLISAAGNVTGSYLFGNGSQLTGLAATYGNANVVANLAALGSNPVSTTGNITGGNLNAAGLSLSSNVVSALNSAANITTSANVSGSYFLGNGSQLTGIDATSIQNGTSNVRVVSSGGNVSVGIGGTSNVAVFATTGAYVTGEISASGNITGGNLVTSAAISAASVSASGNITGGNVNAAGLSLSSNVVSALNVTGAIAGANLTTPGLISATGNITGGNVNVGNITIATDLISSANSVITIDPATSGNAGLVVINGNLQVNGNTTTINSNVVSTNDLTVNYANNAINGAAANGGGVEIGPIGSPFITWLYNNSANAWVSTGGISAVGNVIGGNLNAAGLSLSSNVVSALNVTGAIAGANVTTPGLISATGNITGGNVLGGANVNATTHTGSTVSVSGAITGGSLTVSTGNITGGNIVNAGINGVGNIGNATVGFNTVFAKSTSAQYADLAEKYTADAEYTSGTVLSFGGAQEVTITLTDADHRVAGVVSTDPAYTMNAGLDSEHVATVALTGRVPCSVTGTVRKGDSMVSAGNGVARAEANPAVSTVLGKSLEDFDGESGMIEIVVGRV